MHLKEGRLRACGLLGMPTGALDTGLVELNDLRFD